MIVDCHVHLGKEGIESPEYVLKLMAENNIDKAVVFPAFELRPQNKEMIERIKKYADKFIPFAWINPFFGQDALQELELLKKDYDIKGVKLHPLLNGFFANSEIVIPVMKKIAELDLPVLIHSGHSPFSLPWQIADLAEAFPQVTIIMDHMGLQLGFVPEAIKLAKKYSNIILGTTAMPFHLEIKNAVDALGSGRVVYGSDAPYIHPAPEIMRVKVAELTPEQERAVLGENMLRIVGIRSAP